MKWLLKTQGVVELGELGVLPPPVEIDLNKKLGPSKRLFRPSILMLKASEKPRNENSDAGNRKTSAVQLAHVG